MSLHDGQAPAINRSNFTCFLSGYEVSRVLFFRLMDNTHLFVAWITDQMNNGRPSFGTRFSDPTLIEEIPHISFKPQKV